MCGIGAIINIKNNFSEQRKEIITNSIHNMIMALESRGAHATGICAIHKDSVEILKRPVKASIFVKSNELSKFIDKNWKAKAFLIHDRHYTHGNPKYNYNNHPLESKNYVLIHNGVIRDSNLGAVFDEMVDDSSAIDKRVETDSYFILRVAEYFGIHYIPSINGTNVSIIYDKVNKKLYIFRGSQQTYTLHAGYCDKLGLVAFASTKEALNNTFSKVKRLFNFFEMTKIEYQYISNEFEPNELYSIDLFNDVFFDKIYETDTIREDILEATIGDFVSLDAFRVKNKTIVITNGIPKKVRKILNKSFTRGNIKGSYILAEEDVEDFVTVIQAYEDQIKSSKYRYNSPAYQRPIDDYGRNIYRGVM